MKKITSLCALLLIVSPALANGIPNKLKTFSLDVISYEMCRALRREIKGHQASMNFYTAVVSYKKKIGMNDRDFDAFSEWTTTSSFEDTAVKLAWKRYKHGRGKTKCSMQGDKSWMLFVQKLAQQI